MKKMNICDLTKLAFSAALIATLAACSGGSGGGGGGGGGYAPADRNKVRAATTGLAAVGQVMNQKAPTNKGVQFSNLVLFAASQSEVEPKDAAKRATKSKMNAINKKVKPENCEFTLPDESKCDQSNQQPGNGPSVNGLCTFEIEIKGDQCPMYARLAVDVNPGKDSTDATVRMIATIFDEEMQKELDLKSADLTMSIKMKAIQSPESVNMQLAGTLTGKGEGLSYGAFTAAQGMQVQIEMAGGQSQPTLPGEGQTPNPEEKMPFMGMKMSGNNFEEYRFADGSGVRFEASFTMNEKGPSGNFKIDGKEVSQEEYENARAELKLPGWGNPGEGIGQPGEEIGDGEPGEGPGEDPNDNPGSNPGGLTMICIVNAYKTTDISKQELEQALSNGMMIDAPPVNSLFSCDANKVSEGEVGIRIRYERNSVVVDFEANGNVKGRVLNKSQSRTLVEPIGSDYVASIQCHTTRSCNGVRP